VLKKLAAAELVIKVSNGGRAFRTCFFIKKAPEY